MSTKTSRHLKMARKLADELPDGSHMSLATSLHSLEKLATQWRELEDTARVAPTVFQSFNWIKTWCDVYAQPDSALGIFVVTGFHNNRLVFAWPMALEKRQGIRTLVWLTQPIGQYGDLLCHRDFDTNAWVAAALGFIRSTRQVDCFHLRHVRDTSNFAPVAKKSWCDGKLHERAPAMDLTAFASDAAYEARYDSQQRKRRKRIRKSLEELGPVGFRAIGPGAKGDGTIDMATHEKLRWLESKGRFNRVLRWPGHAEFLKRLSRLDGAGMRVQTMELTAGERPIAWEIGFRYQNKHYGYLTAHVLELTSTSPGRTVFDLSQRMALADGCKEYDLMVPYDKHKESWSSKLEPVNDYYLPTTLRGIIYGHLYLGWARPLIRKIYMGIPDKWLGTIQLLTRH